MEAAFISAEVTKDRAGRGSGVGVEDVEKLHEQYKAQGNKNQAPSNQLSLGA